VYEIISDPERSAVLSLDETYQKRFPWAVYPEANPRAIAKAVKEATR